MEIGVMYVVTRDGDDGTLRVGDHIYLAEDGSLMCREAGGWIGPERVPMALRGVSVELDTEWAERKLRRIEQETLRICRAMHGTAPIATKKIERKNDGSR